MPLIQPGQGSMPSKFDLGLEGMGDALQSFADTYQKEKKDQQDRADKNREFDQKQQELDATKENTKIMRQAQLRQSLMENAGRIGQQVYDNAIKNNLPEADAMRLKDYATKQYIASVVGTDIDQAEETYGSPMKDYMLENGKDSNSNGPKGNPGKPADQVGTPTGNALAAAKNQGGFNPQFLAEGLGAGWLAGTKPAQAMMTKGLQGLAGLIPQSSTGIPGFGNIPGGVMADANSARAMMTGAVPGISRMIPGAIGTASVAAPLLNALYQSMVNKGSGTIGWGQANANANQGLDQNGNPTL